MTTPNGALENAIANAKEARYSNTQTYTTANSGKKAAAQSRTRAPKPPPTHNDRIRAAASGLRYRAGREQGGGSILSGTNGIGYAWLVAMIIVSFDEWKNNNVLPRPARLWDTTIVYGLLAMAGLVEIVAPFVSVLAWGYTIVLLYEFYNKSGSFADTGGGTRNESGRQELSNG